MTQPSLEGLLLIDKPKGRSSFSLIPPLRKLTQIQKIGHAGTLDPLASGLLVLLIGRSYTRRSNEFLQAEKVYLTQIRLGIRKDTYDAEGKEIDCSSYIPLQEEVEKILFQFQGETTQSPPMFCAKKIGGKKLYRLARQGKEIHREPVKIHLQVELLSYLYPYLELRVTCSKGTYIRSLADDIGLALGSFGYVEELRRIRSGSFGIDEAIDWELLLSGTYPYSHYLKEF